MSIEQTESLNGDNLLKVLAEYRDPGMVRVSSDKGGFEDVSVGMDGGRGVETSKDLLTESHLGRHVNVWA